MEWVSLSERKPEINESVVLAINYSRSRRPRFWKKKIIAFGWLEKVEMTKKGVIYKFYDHTNNCHWRKSVTHWMSVPKPPESSAA